MVDVFLYDELGPAWAGMIDADMVAKEIKAAGKEPIRLRINSPGGSAWVGMAIYSLLKDHKPGVDVVVDGIAASAATVPMLAGRTITVSESGMVMIHRSMTLTFGNQGDHRKSIDALDAHDRVIAGLYASKTGKSEDEIAALLDAETWMTAHEALAHGFATAVTGPSGVKNYAIKEGRFAKTPQALLTAELPRESQRRAIESYYSAKLRLTNAGR